MLGASDVSTLGALAVDGASDVSELGSTEPSADG